MPNRTGKMKVVISYEENSRKTVEFIVYTI